MSAATKVGNNEVALTDLATEIRTEHEAVRTAAETATHHAIQCGQLLTRAKDGLVHGEWLPWLQDHCHLSERTAQAYMRLSRKHSELDGPKAQRVADLPVREAMRAIADERAEAPLPTLSSDGDEPTQEDVWAWAKQQVNGPFNAFDLDNDSCLRAKLIHQTEVPSTAAFCLGYCGDDIPVIRLVPWDELVTALKHLAPVAQGKMGELDIDFADLDLRDNSTKNRNSAIFLTSCIELWAQWLCGHLLREWEYREKTYNADAEDANWTAWRDDAKQVADAFLANSAARRERLLEETRAEGAAA